MTGIRDQKSEVGKGSALSVTQRIESDPPSLFWLLRFGVEARRVPGQPATKGVSPSACNNGFRQGLRDIGYVEGTNILVEYRFASGLPDRVPDLLAELVRLKPDLLRHSSIFRIP
jgi:hypothetical protein